MHTLQVGDTTACPTRCCWSPSAGRPAKQRRQRSRRVGVSGCSGSHGRAAVPPHGPQTTAQTPAAEAPHRVQRPAHLCGTVAVCAGASSMGREVSAARGAGARPTAGMGPWGRQALAAAARLGPLGQPTESEPPRRSTWRTIDAEHCPRGPGPFQGTPSLAGLARHPNQSPAWQSQTVRVGYDSKIEDPSWPIITRARRRRALITATVAQWSSIALIAAATRHPPEECGARYFIHRAISWDNVHQTLSYFIDWSSFIEHCLMKSWDNVQSIK